MLPGTELLIIAPYEAKNEIDYVSNLYGTTQPMNFNGHSKEIIQGYIKKAGVEMTMGDDDDYYGADYKGWALAIDGKAKANGQAYEAEGYISFDYQTCVWIYEVKNYTITIEVFIWELIDEFNEIRLTGDTSLYIKSVARDNTSNSSVTKESSANILKGSVATWYKVMMEIALVGLLAVLVYVAIRMILSSSAEDKAKYKKMIADWFAAICIIFLLHYFMAITLQISQALSNVFNSTIIGESGEDVLMSNIRTQVENGGSFEKEFANIVIYLVLVILTVMFTYQYLKRFIYAVFLTMIAPLIALTYPLDKIKDGRAQAFNVWLREYVFNTLIQVVHLIIYYILVGSATDLLDINNHKVFNPIYAIAVISFILPAEKFIRKMFGFDKSEATNTIGSAFGGAAIMSGINKLGSLGAKKKGNGEGIEKESSKIRTVNNDTSNAGGNQAPNSGSQNNGNQGIANQNTGLQNGGNSSTTVQSGSGSQTGSNQIIGKRNIKNKTSVAKGIGNVAKRYVFNKNTGKKLLRGAAKVVGAATLGTIGLAAGIATGDASKALGGALGGITAGKNLGGRVVDGGANIITGAKTGIRNIKDTYREGKYGQEDEEE